MTTLTIQATFELDEKCFYINQQKLNGEKLKKYLLHLISNGYLKASLGHELFTDIVDTNCVEVVTKSENK